MKLSATYSHDLQVTDASVSGNPKFELRFKVSVIRHEGIAYLQSRRTAY